LHATHRSLRELDNNLGILFGGMLLLVINRLRSQAEGKTHGWSPHL
jgi:hypothetical protein